MTTAQYCTAYYVTLNVVIQSMQTEKSALFLIKSQVFHGCLQDSQDVRVRL